MTDARFPERWLNDRRVVRLSDPAFRLHMVALTWSVSNRTDGVVDAVDLPLLLGVDAGRVDELVRAGLWKAEEQEVWSIVDYVSTQATAAQLAGLEHKRVMDRERQARHRGKHRTGSEPPDPGVTRDVTRDGTRDTKDRTGQDRRFVQEEPRTEVNTRTHPRGTSSSRLGVAPVPDGTCPSCSWPLDSEGHHDNCLGETA